MSRLRAFSVRLGSLFTQRRTDRELEEEIRFHLETLTQENIRRGMDPASALAEARRQFGGVDQAVESYRDQRGFPIIEEIFQDVRFALRILMRSPSATAISLLALALGIGAVSCLFTTVNAILLKPLPFEDLDRLVRIWDTDPKHGATHNMVSAADFLDWREQSKSFKYMSALNYWGMNLTGIDDPQRLQGYVVSSAFFTALGMPPLMGRTFFENEEQPGQDETVVLSYGLWQRCFASDPKIVGKQLSLNGRAHTVVGVMPADFDFPLGTDIWKPLAFNPQQRGSRDGRFLFVLARLQRGSGIEQAEAEMKAIAGRLAGQFPKTNEGHGARVQRLRDVLNVVTDRFVAILMGAAGFVLLLACANVANIQLARIASREREMALRITLGARRWRIARQLLVENILLAGLGGALGLALAIWGLDAMRLGIPAQVYKWVAGLKNLKIDATVLAFTGAIVILTGLLCGLAPALHASRRMDLSNSMKEGNRGGGPETARRPVRNILVVTEVALALILLVAAGLMVKAFQHMMTFDMGFNPRGLLTMQASLPPLRYQEPTSIRTFFDQTVEKLQALPEVESAGAASSRGSVIMTEFRVEGQPARPQGETLPGLQFIDGNFFAAMGIPVRKGRPLLEQDEGAKPAAVAVISESVARRFWKTPEDSVGSAIHIGGYAFPPMTVVGVAGDVKDWFTGESEETVYLSNAHMPQRSMGLLIRTRIDPAGVIAPARAQIHSVDRNQPIYDIKSMEESLEERTSGVRLSAVMMSAFAFIALFLAASGIYGIVSYSVSQRTQEIGVRMALGARSGMVLRLVVGQAFRLAATGLVIGVIAAFLLARLMSSLLFGVIDPDLLTFAGFSALLGGSALLAGYIPARRATRVDPMIALRCE
jgi:putative ABC transport system permease protein